MLKSFMGVMVLALICPAALHAAEKNTWIDPIKAKAENPDFLIQGEYGQSTPGATWGLQVIALGNGKFDGYLLEAGLPGLGWERGKKRIKLTGETSGRKVTLKDTNSTIVTIANGTADVIVGGASHSLPRIERKSPTLDAKAPDGATVLFDGTTADGWKNGKLDGKLLQNTDAMSKKRFGSYKLHLEFRTPFKPFARGQGRGNSGVYHQGRYETQVLDSFGLEGKMNETGGIYSIARPKTNACLPPLSWQTYDVDFTTAQWENGKKIKNARITVKLNGIIVHDDQELPKSTAASPLKESADPGPIFLQHHGNPVRYRNIWIVDKGNATAAKASKKPEGRVIKMAVMHGHLRYDVESFTVQPKEKVSIVFHNNDEMQHNIVVCKPGTNTNALGMAAIALGVEGIKKQYIPDSKEILHVTPLIEPGDTYTMSFTAPDKVGKYPYVCTFPGHFNVMKGIMTVATKTKSPLSNLKESLFVGNWKKLPKFDDLKAKSSRKAANNLISLDLGKKLKAGFGILFEGTFTAPANGEYVFTLAGDDGVRLIVAGKKIAEDDGLHPMRNKTGKIKLKPGDHPLRLEYFEGGGGRGITLSVSGPGLPNTSLTTGKPAAAPKKKQPAVKYEVGDTVEIYRTGLSFGKKYPYAICVGFPNGTSCAFDADSCSLIGAWHGGFVDPSKDWTGRGGSGSRPIGTTFIQANTSAPLPTIENSDAKPFFNGYRVDGNDVIFLYTIGSAKISQRVHSDPTAGGLIMTIQADNAAGSTLRLPPPKTNNIKLSGAEMSNGAVQATITNSTRIEIMVKK